MSVQSIVIALNFTNKMKLLFVLLLIVCIFNQNVNSYRFLAILPVTSKSHYYIGHNLMKSLAEEGHDVTVISPFKAKQPIKNYHEVFLEYSWEISRKSKMLFSVFVICLIKSLDWQFNFY